MWETNSTDDKWGPSYHDIEQFFSYGSYYNDYGYNHYYANNNGYNQQPYNNTSNYYQQINQYPGVNNNILFSLENGLLDLSTADANQPSHAVHVHQTVPYYPMMHLHQPQTNHAWHDHGSSSMNYSQCNEGVEIRKKIDKISPCNIPNYCDVDENFLEIVDEVELKGQVISKRLDKIVPIAHTPKINGDIPSINEASSDHQRLLDRLALFGFVESQVEGDGNCQFRALSEQLYRTPNHHKSVRKRVFRQLKTYPKMYEGYVPMAYTDYLKQISKRGEWGDHVTLQAAADSYGVKILVITSFKDTIFIEILPKLQKSKRVIFLSYWAEVHYNSMYHEGELPPSENEKKNDENNNDENNNNVNKNENDKKNKKKWWNFKN